MEKYEFIDIFDLTRPTFKIKNEIKLIELFAGYGSQALALKYLGVNFTHHRTCEWAIKSIQAYNDLHIRDYTNYSKPLNEEQVKNFLFKKGISANYNEPMTKARIDEAITQELEKEIVLNEKETAKQQDIFDFLGDK